jgi:prepilin-type N-terminal cleavage/methylation domain-containing protein
MSNIKKRSEGGFTIIEVLIVLAIAGLIMLIVFLAVPALQRNSRNTQRKNDVSGLLSAASEFVSNNGGTTPGAISISGTNATICDAATCGTNVTPATAKVGYYTSAMLGSTSISAFGTMPTAADKVYMYSGATCSGNVAIAGSARSIVAIYGVEGSGNSFTWNCVGA